MKRIMILIGIVGIVMVLAVSPSMVFESAFASQIMGTPLHTDPGAHERIMSSPQPEGFRFGWSSPRSIDLEVEWRAIGPKDGYRDIRGIFIDSNGTIRAVTGWRGFMTGKRVWLSRNNGRNWRIEKQIGNAWADRSALLGPEKARMIFGGGGTRKFRDWPLEVEELLKTEFRGLYEHRAPRSSAMSIFLARDPNNEKVMAFAARGRNTRIFITIDAGEKWIEINFPHPPLLRVFLDARGIPLKHLPGGLAIAKRGNVLRVFLGTKGYDPTMLQLATLSLSEIRETLAKR